MIRPWTMDDAEASFGVFRDAVLGAGRHYTAAERHAWMPVDTMPEGWIDRLTVQAAWVSGAEGRLTGLISLANDGYLDLFFVVPEARGDGTAACLYDALLGHARAQNLHVLTTHASLYLQPFLDKRGWTTLYPETVERNRQSLRRFAMELRLT